jgi:hypothetical protein
MKLPRRLTWTAACRLCNTVVAELHQFSPPRDFYVEFVNLFAKRIAINPQQIGTFRLITPRCIKRDFNHGRFNLSQDARM